mgnify:CR=1 FL=1
MASGRGIDKVVRGGSEPFYAALVARATPPREPSLCRMKSKRLTCLQEALRYGQEVLGDAVGMTTLHSNMPSVYEVVVLARTTGFPMLRPMQWLVFRTLFGRISAGFGAYYGTLLRYKAVSFWKPAGLSNT